MNKVSVDELQSGMLLAESIYSSNGSILVAEGALINEPMINRLKALKSEVYIYDEKTIRQQPGEILEARAVNYAMKVLDGYIPLHLYSVENELIQDKHKRVAGFIEKIFNNPIVSKYFMDLRTKTDFLFEHSVNVCVLSLIVGVGLGLDDKMLDDLGTGALLHDVGVLGVDESVLQTKAEQRDADAKVFYEEHTSKGYQLLRDDGFAAPIAKICLYHHERWDGGGYPTRIKGEEIDLLSRIVSVCDVFDSFTGEINAKQYLPHEAIEYLYGAGNLYFDARVVKAFIAHVFIYPLGTVVKLSTGEIGIVVNVEKNVSPRPIVKILYDREGHKLPYGQQLDLYREKTIFIKKVLW